MLRQFFFVTALLGAALCVPLSNAASITHFNADATTVLTVDDNGGEDDGYNFEEGGNSLLSTRSGPILWDGTEFYNGPERSAYTPGGITLNDPSAVPGVSEDAVANFSAGPFQVEQTTFVVDGSRFVIHQWIVTNTSVSAVDAKILLAEDWDVGGSSNNIAAYDAPRRLAYQQNESNFSTAGSGFLSGTFDSYYIWDCCDITFDDGTTGNTEDYMNGIISGDISTGGGTTANDKEVGVSANLGTLAPGDSACSAFVSVAVGDPASLAVGLSQLQAEFDAAAALFATLPACGTASPLTLATPVPTISAYGLALTMLGLLLVATRRLRASAKRS
jgi:hypothetical protein